MLERETQNRRPSFLRRDDRRLLCPRANIRSGQTQSPFATAGLHRSCGGFDRRGRCPAAYSRETRDIPRSVQEGTQIAIAAHVGGCCLERARAVIGKVENALPLPQQTARVRPLFLRTSPSPGVSENALDQVSRARMPARAALQSAFMVTRKQGSPAAREQPA